MKTINNNWRKVERELYEATQRKKQAELQRLYAENLKTLRKAGGKAKGLKVCKILDNEGLKLLFELNISPYIARYDVDNCADRQRARRYYEAAGLKCSEYEMHHTRDGFNIVPVLKEHHKQKHIGGSYFINEYKMNILCDELEELDKHINREELDLENLFEV